MYLDRQTPPKTLDQSHFQRRGVVNHVSGLKRKGCPGTLTLTPALRACDSSRHSHCFPRLASGLSVSRTLCGLVIVPGITTVSPGLRLGLPSRARFAGL